MGRKDGHNMAETIKFLSYTGLQKYDSLIKPYILEAAENAASSSFKAVGLADGVLHFYTETPFDENSVPAYSITLPKEDLSSFMKLVDGAVTGNLATFGENGQVVDSGVAISTIATKAEVQAIQDAVDALDEKMGDIPVGDDGNAVAATVIEYVNKKTEGIATDAALGELQAQLSAAQEAIDAIEADYLVEADKTELSEAITAEKERAEGIESGLRTDVDAIKADYLKAADKTELSNAIAAEKERAEGVEAGLEGRLVEVETFFKTAEGETLDTALDTLVEIQKYLDGEGEVADQMLLDIAANKKAIEDHVATDHDFAGADAALKEELVAEINKKAAQTDLEAEVTARTNADSALDARITTLEGKFTGDESVDAKIEAAIETAAADATSKANTAEANAIAKANELNTAMDTRVKELEEIDHEAYVAADTALEAKLNDAIALKADKTALDEEVQARKDADAAIEAKIGTVAENKTVVQMIADAQTAATYDDEEVRGLISDNADAVSALTETHNTDKAALEAKDAELQAAIDAIEEISPEEISALFA